MSTSTTITVHRIEHEHGYVEFAEGELAAASAYRDAHHPGAPITTLEKTISLPEPEPAP